MADKQKQPEPISEEQLVAFLDGELDEQTAARVRHAMETDSELRGRLESLSGAWDMLDQLQQPQVKTDFTESTMERVALAAQDDIEKSNTTGKIERIRRYAAIAAGLFAAGFVGFFGVSLTRPDPDRQLLEDLPVVQRLDEYRQIDSIEFLYELRESELFSEDQPDE